MSWPENSFDLVWACESGEHMPDKKRYVEEMTRVLKPGPPSAVTCGMPARLYEVSSIVAKLVHCAAGNDRRHADHCDLVPARGHVRDTLQRQRAR
jgi:ubiquinone/menaquinone biosynthesis C-methylase UbiE